MQTIQMLCEFGLSRLEATVYVALCEQGSMNGYEAGKITGVSRSNIYAALAGLVDKGAAYATRDAKATRYTPLTPQEFCRNRLQHLAELQQTLIRLLPLSPQPEAGYVTVKGAQHILDRMRTMLEQAQQRVYIAAPTDVLEQLDGQLHALVQQGKKLVVIAQPPYALPQATIYLVDKPVEQIRLIADSQRVLTGTIVHGKQATCLYSGQTDLVEIFKDSLKNEIQLIQLTRDIHSGSI